MLQSTNPERQINKERFTGEGEIEYVLWVDLEWVRMRKGGIGLW